MIQKITFILFCCLITLLGPLEAKEITAYLDYKLFYSPADGPYIETYLSVAGNSVIYVQNKEGSYAAAVEVTLLILQDEKVLKGDKYTLNAPVQTDTNVFVQSFTGQQRYTLPKGTYTLVFSITDVNNPKKFFSNRQQIVVDFPATLPWISDIQLLESFSKSESGSVFDKSGYRLIPFVSDYYPSSVAALKFYAEVYNADTAFGNKPFLVNYFIQSAHRNKVIGNYRGYVKLKPSQVCPVMAEFNIAGLATGNYKLVLEVRDNKYELFALKELFFSRSNSALPVVDTTGGYSGFAGEITNADTLADYIQSLRPVSSDMEQVFSDNQLVVKNLEYMQKYFYMFWLKRDSLNPAGAWAKYHASVQMVNAAYSSRIRRGYDTDRGRVYLKYGPPNVISQSYHEPSAYPYEIWQYYSLDNQTGRKFVFYNPDLVTNDFTLLHSDAIGEVHDSAWQTKLLKRNNTTRDIDLDKFPDHYGGKADENYALPK